MISVEIDDLLEKIKKKDPRLTKSKAVEYAVREAFKDPLQHAKSKMKFHQRELMRWKDEHDRLKKYEEDEVDA